MQNNSRNHAGRLWTYQLIHVCNLAIVVCAEAQAPLTQATYFSYRLQHLNQALQITAAQEEQIKQVVEQETAELNEVVCNPATSRKYQLQRTDAILRQSDASMRPILTVQQFKKLPQVREAEMSRLRSLKPPSSCTDAYWMLGKQ